MAFRLLEIVVPVRETSGVRELLDGRPVLGVYRDTEADRVLLKTLVLAEDVEPIMDRLQRRYAGVEMFRLVLLPVEASIPRLEEPPPPPPATDALPEPEPAKRYRVSREELYAEVADGTKASPVFVAMTALSSVVAAVGLLRDNLAVVIGAMVIAPLLSPNVALALATTLGDLRLALDALKANLVGVLIALSLSIGLGFVFAVDPTVPAIASRTTVGAADVVLALAAGAAGTLAFTTGLSGAVIGVMVAVALLPPLVTFGLLLGSGYLVRAMGAWLLLSANVICVNLAGVTTFLIQGVRPLTWWEAERAKKASRAALLLWILLLAVLAAILVFAHPEWL